MMGCPAKRAMYYFTMACCNGTVLNTLHHNKKNQEKHALKIPFKTYRCSSSSSMPLRLAHSITSLIFSFRDLKHAGNLMFFCSLKITLKKQDVQSLYSLDLFRVFRMGSPDLKVRCDDEDQLMEVTVLTVF